MDLGSDCIICLAAFQDLLYQEMSRIADPENISSFNFYAEFHIYHILIFVLFFCHIIANRKSVAC